MADSIEERFVKAFVRKERQERLLYELMTPKKRYDGISRFCHQAQDLLEPSKIAMEGEDLERRPDFERFVQRHDEVCRVLSPDSFLNEQDLPFPTAVEQAALCCDAVLIIGNGFAVVYGEPMKGGRGKYLLTEKTGQGKI